MTDEQLDAKLLRVLRSRRGWVEKAICVGLQACIAAHGPITPEWKGSAGKRVWAELIALARTEYGKLKRKHQQDKPKPKPQDGS